MRFSFYVFLSLIVVSCQSKSGPETCGSAWIGGQIVNPKTDYVIISHNRNSSDTVYLDQSNFFRYHIKAADPGLYYFQHFEFQAMFVEPGDSIMLRVNTLEFDESLTYTGPGAAKNNFLTELFLLNESADQEILSFYNLDPETFIQKMDSVRLQRQSFLDEFNKSQEVSKAFMEVANAAIDYAIYGKMELYVASNNKRQRFGEQKAIPSSFFDYRKKIDLGHEDLRTYYPYFRCLGYYFDNLAFDAIKGQKEFNRMSFDHNWHKMDLIQAKITNDALKQSLLKNTVINYFINAENTEHMALILDKFNNYNQSSEDKKVIAELSEIALRLMPNQPLPNLELVNYENQTLKIHEVITRPTVIYFWSLDSPMHVKNVHQRISELRVKYPEFDFIGINVDDQFKKWKRLVQHESYRAEYEFQFEDFEKAGMALLVNSIHKTMMVDSNGVIIDPHTNIFSLDIEQKLLNYLNK
ncbi:MAG TPA: hypothetical protein DCZ44_06075 [Flavobacteriaceae bacterium]|nr:hypothetical protein [Flavobacteriaceae bacterium]